MPLTNYRKGQRVRIRSYEDMVADFPNCVDIYGGIELPCVYFNIEMKKYCGRTATIGFFKDLSSSKRDFDGKTSLVFLNFDDASNYPNTWDWSTHMIEPINE